MLIWRKITCKGGRGECDLGWKFSDFPVRTDSVKRCLEPFLRTSICREVVGKMRWQGHWSWAQASGCRARWPGWPSPPGSPRTSGRWSPSCSIGGTRRQSPSLSESWLLCSSPRGGAWVQDQACSAENSNFEQITQRRHNHLIFNVYTCEKVREVTGPCPSVIRSTVSSWKATAVPSEVKLTSNSTHFAPLAAANLSIPSSESHFWTLAN